MTQPTIAACPSPRDKPRALDLHSTLNPTIGGAETERALDTVELPAPAGAGVFNRRSVIMNALVSATAIAAATPIAVAASIPDAELAQLGQALIAAWPESARLCRASHERNQRAWVTARERTGIQFSVGCGHPDMTHLARHERQRVYEAWTIASEEECTAAGDDALAADDAFQGDLMEKIAALPASSILGLAAKAAAAASMNTQLWEADLDGIEYDERKVRELVEAVLALAGAPNPYAAHSPLIEAVDEVEIPAKKPDRVLEALTELQAKGETLAAWDKKLTDLSRRSVSAKPAIRRTEDRFDFAVSEWNAAFETALTEKASHGFTAGIQCRYIAKILGNDSDVLDNNWVRPAVVTMLQNVAAVVLPEEELDFLLEQHGPAVSSSPVIASVRSDLRVRELANRYEPLLKEYFRVCTIWGPALRSAHVALHEKFGFERWNELGPIGSKRRLKAENFFHAKAKENGCDRASRKMEKLFKVMEPIADAITASETSSLEGLRAKTLVMLFECRPSSCDSGELDFAHDGDSTESLFRASVALTGLAPLVQEIEENYKIAYAKLEA